MHFSLVLMAGTENSSAASAPATPAKARVSSSAAGASTPAGASGAGAGVGSPSSSSSSNPLARKLDKVLRSHEALLRAPLPVDRPAAPHSSHPAPPGTAATGQEIVQALRGLADVMKDNSKHGRQRLRGDIEKQALHINQDFVTAFAPVQQALNAVVAEMDSMAKSCADMTQRLSAAKQETADLIKKTTALQNQQQQMELRGAVLRSFLENYQLTAEEEAVLNGQAAFNESFFKALQHLQQIHFDCRRLLGTKHQRAGLDIMESMAALQETAYERLYRWTQSSCRALTSEVVDHSKLLAMAFAALRARPVLFQYSLNEFATARRTAIVRAFIDALTHGGPGGTPKPIEMHAHDPLRYISDMLAWIHQCLASERELLCQVLAVRSPQEEAGAGGSAPVTPTEMKSPRHALTFFEEDKPKAMDTLDSIMEGACRPLRVRAETVLTSEPGIIVCFQIANVIHFYNGTANEILGPKSNLVETLQALRNKALKVFYDALNFSANELLANVELPRADLQPPEALEASLETLRSVLTSQNSAYASTEEKVDQYETILSTILEPLLQMCSLTATNLGAADMATFMINCLYRIQNVLTLFEFTDARIEQLDAQIATHVDTLIEAQAQHAARRSGLEYFIQRAAEWHREDENERPALAQVESMSPETLRRAMAGFDRWLADATFDLLPQCELLLSTRIRETVQSKATQRFAERYKELYDAFNDPANGYKAYGIPPIVARSPEQVLKLMG